MPAAQPPMLSPPGCRAISADGVRALLAAPLPKTCLLQLDMSRCPRITRAALALPATVRGVLVTREETV